MDIKHHFTKCYNKIRYLSIRECLSFKIHEDDAREIYPKISEELNNAVDSIKTYYSINTEQNEFTNLERNNKHILITKTLWNEIQKILIDFKMLNKLKNEVRQEIEKILKDPYKDTYLTIAVFLGALNPKKTVSDIMPIVYDMMITKDYSLRHFEKATISGIKLQDIDVIKKDIEENKKIQKFIKELEKFESFSKKIRKDAMNEYKDNLQKPEFTRNILTLLVLAMAIIGGCIAWEEKQDNKELMKDNKLLIERQLDSIAPLHPELEYYIPKRMLFLNQEYLVKEERVYLYMLVSNIGQFPAGYVKIQLGNGQISCWTQGDGQGRTIEYLNETDIVGLQFYCRSSSLLMLGVQELNITMDCQYCNEKRKDTINVCIYHSMSEQNCGEEWSMS